MPRHHVRTHYENLKVSRDAPIEVIRAAYRSLSAKYHPDRNPNDAEAARIMVILNKSHAVLSDPGKRKEHDAWIARSELDREHEEDCDPAEETEDEPMDLPPLTAGSCLYSEMPVVCQRKLLQRLAPKQPNRLLVRMGRIWGSYVSAAVALCVVFVHCFRIPR